MLSDFFSPEQWKELDRIGKQYGEVLNLRFGLLERYDAADISRKPAIEEFIEGYSQWLKDLDSKRNRIYNNRKFK
jgi:hypothetical protein